jgi:hypothetical protein
MNREVHVRFWESPEVKVLRATRQLICYPIQEPVMIDLAVEFDALVTHRSSAFARGQPNSCRFRKTPKRLICFPKGAPAYWDGTGTTAPDQLVEQRKNGRRNVRR